MQRIPFFQEYNDLNGFCTQKEAVGRMIIVMVKKKWWSSILVWSFLARHIWRHEYAYKRWEL